ncbi:33847_t:CDS:1, partial [Racocetra persica]
DNEFEIALWLAYHRRILNLVINIRNRMMTRIEDKKHDMAPVFTLIHKPVSKFSEIYQ